MNSSIIIQLLANGKNDTSVYTSLASALYAIGFIPATEILYMTIYLAVSIAGFFLNILTMLTTLQPAMSKSNSPPLFAYMRYQAIIGIVGNLAGAAYGINTCSDLVSIVNNYTSQWIMAYLALPLYTMAYYAKFLIEIAIVVDRIIMLVPTLPLAGLLKVKRPYLVMIFVCLFTIFIDYPYIYLLITPVTTNLVSYGPVKTEMFTFFSVTRGAWSFWPTSGYFIMLFIYIFKHVVTFAFETVLNITSLVLFQRHLARKRRIVVAVYPHTRHENNNKSNNSAVMMNTTTAGAGSSMHTAHNENNRNNGGESEGSAGGRNMAMLFMLLSVTGFAHSSLLTGYTLYGLVYPKQGVASRVLQFSSTFASALRHAANFLLFYFFNATFRKTAREVFVNMRRCGMRDRRTGL
jgi:hypothetical protein